MAVLGGLAEAAVEGKNLNADIVVAIKVDGTWQSIYSATGTNTAWKTVANGGQVDFAIDQQPTYENTGGADVVITDICIGATQDVPGFISGLNTNEANEANNLIIPIHAVQGSPRTVVPLEIVQFTTIKTTIQSP